MKSSLGLKSRILGIIVIKKRLKKGYTTRCNGYTFHCVVYPTQDRASTPSRDVYATKHDDDATPYDGDPFHRDVYPITNGASTLLHDVYPTHREVYATHSDVYPTAGDG